MLKVTNIIWDITDKACAKEGSAIILPNEMIMPNDNMTEEEVSEYLTEETGFCHKGFTLKKPPSMKFFIGQDGASGISCNSFDEFVQYLKDEVENSREAGKEHFSITIENDD